mgnify:CR=1 FL=1
MLVSNISVAVQEYGLEHLKYTAFIIVSGYKSLLSASDMSLAVTALLECDTSKSKDSMQNGDNGAEAELDEEEEEDEENGQGAEHRFA